MMNILKSWETGLCMFLLAFIGLMSSCTDDEFNIRNNLETYQWFVVSYSWSSADGTDAGTVDALSKEALWAYFYEEGKGVFCDERGTEPSMEDFKWQVEDDMLIVAMSGRHIAWHVEISGGTSADNRLVLTLHTDDYWGDGSKMSVTVRMRRA